MTSIAGIDMALWDLKGKAAGLPVYQLFGGKSQLKIKIYSHANGKNIDENLKHLEKLIENGHQAVRLI